MFTRSGNERKERESLNTQTDYETSKNEQIKKKQTSSLCFVNVFKVQDRLKKFLRNKNDINLKKDFFKKPSVIMIIT